MPLPLRLAALWSVVRADDQRTIYARGAILTSQRNATPQYLPRPGGPAPLYYRQAEAVSNIHSRWPLEGKDGRGRISIQAVAAERCQVERAGCPVASCSRL